jgi:hypothetical protein
MEDVLKEVKMLDMKMEEVKIANGRVCVRIEEMKMQNGKMEDVWMKGVKK